jgi:hypothetical protein
MAYSITKDARVIEICKTLGEATRAFWILTAHELKNGRVADYRLDTRSSNGVDPPELCKPPLPDWAIEALQKEGFFS